MDKGRYSAAVENSVLSIPYNQQTLGTLKANPEKRYFFCFLMVSILRVLNRIVPCKVFSLFHSTEVTF